MAGTIESLKFDVILEDKEFKRLVNEDITLAKNLNTSLSNVIKIRSPRDIISSQGVQNAKSMYDYLGKIENKIKNMPKGSYLVGDADQLNKTLQLVNANLDKMVAKQKEGAAATKLQNSAFMRTSSILQALTQITGVAFSVVGLRRFLSALIDITGQFEVQKMALRSMLRDIDGADKIFEDLYRFSSESTYRFSELAKYAKQLAAFNIDQNNLLETTKMLGDVASGVGTSMDRLILAYGHVKSSGFLRGIQLRSFSQNGVPILEELAKMFSEVENRAVSLGEVFDKMMKREIPFEMVEEGFRRMTSEGGKFYQMQEVLAKTLAGQINILKGRWENLLAAIGQANSGVLKDTVAWMSNLVSSMDNVGRLVGGLISGFSAYQIALFTSVAVTKNLSAAMNVGLVGAMKRVIKSFAAMIAANPYAALAASVAVAALAIHQWATNMSDAEKIQNELTKGVKDYKAALVVEQAELDRLYTKMRLAKEGTDDYNTAKGELMNRFGPYIQELKAEGVQVNNLASIYENLTTKIQDANKQRFLEATTQGITTKYGDATQEILENFQYTMKVAGQKLSAAEQETLWQYVTGTVDKEFIRLNTRLIGYLDRGGNNNAYTGGSYNETYSVEQLKAQYTSATDAYNTARDAAEEAFKVTQRLGGETKKNTEEAAYDVSSIVVGIKEIDKRIEEIRRKARSGKISQSEKDELEQLLKDRAADAKEYEDIMGVKYDKDQRGVAKGESAAEKAIRDKISGIRADMALLEKFKSAYDKLEPVLGADAARAWVFNNMGHDVANLDAEFERLIATLRDFGEEGEDAAEAIEARLGLGQVNKLVKAQEEAQKAQKALEKYQQTFRQWASEDFNLGGTGFEYDINKIFSKYNTDIGKVDEKYIQAVKEAEEAHKGNAAAIAEEIRKLGELRDAEKAYVQAQAQESLNKLAESYLQDQYLLRGVNMEHLGDMSLKQLRDLRKELQEISRDAVRMTTDFSGIEGFLGSLGYDIENLTEEDIESLNDKLPETTIQMVRLWKATKDAGLSFDTLNDKIQSAINKGLKNLDEQEKKSIVKLGKYAAKQVLELADAFRELGEASGNAGLTSAANSISEIADIAKSAMEGFSQGGWIGAVIGGVVAVAKKFIEADVEAQKFKNTVIEIQEEIRHTNALNSLSFDNIFGNGDLKRLGKAKELLEETQEVIYDTLLKPRIERGKMLPNSLMERMRQLGLELYNENGEINREAIEGMQKLYPDDPRFQKILDNLDEYNEAMKVVNDVSEQIVGSAVSSVADKLVDSWWQAGQAALDYSDIIGDVAKAYAKLIVQDMLLETAFDDERQDAFKEALKNGKTSEAMAIVEAAMQSAVDMLPAVNEALQVLEPYRNMASESLESNSVGTGIKSITEDTANLLASYINAIRADVSVIRGLQEQGWESINLLGASVPTLNEHLAQVAANTFDTAQATQSVLSELRSVIGAPGTSGMVVRVEAY